MIYNENITEQYLCEILKSIFEHYYFNSFNVENNQENYKLFKKDIINSFLEKVKINFEIGEDYLPNLYNDIYEDIRKIRKCLNKKGNEEDDDDNDFKLSNFYNKCMTIKVRHLSDILIDISQIILKINNSNKKRIILGDYYGLNSLCKILEEINNVVSSKDLKPLFFNLIICDSKLLNNDNSAIKKVCSKLMLYNQLLKDKYIITDKITPEFYLNKIINFIKYKSFIHFKLLIMYLYNYQPLLDRFIFLFPFQKLVDENELTCEKEKDDEEEEELIKKLKDHKSISVLWLELFYIYWNKKINFTIKIDNSIYNFRANDNKNNSIIKPTFIFNSSSGFYLAKDSSFNYINLDDNKEELSQVLVQKVSRYDSYSFYQWLLEFSNYEKYVPTSKQIDDFEMKSEEEENLIFNKFTKEKQYSFDIEGLFKQGEILTSINKILSIHFNYSEKIIKELKDEYFTETEKKIYDLLFESFDQKLLKNDYILYSELIRILNIFFKNNIDLFDELVNIDNLNRKERFFYLDKIENALTNLKEYKKKYIEFDFQYFISVLEKKKENIENINIENENKKEREN